MAAGRAFMKKTVAEASTEPAIAAQRPEPCLPRRDGFLAIPALNNSKTTLIVNVNQALANPCGLAKAMHCSSVTCVRQQRNEAAFGGFDPPNQSSLAPT